MWDNGVVQRAIALAAALILLLVIAWAVVPGAQRGIFEGRRRASPHESTSATIDGATLSIVYGRPSMRGRTIFGGLVPFDVLWCPGADEATMLATDRPLRFEGLNLGAGEYSLWMVPTERDWTLVFNSDAHTFHTRHSARDDVGTVKLVKETLGSPVEQLTFTLGKNPKGGGAIVMTWATTKVSAPFTVER
jgi:hypothetical protein